MTDFRRGLVTNTLYASVGLYSDYAATLLVSIIVARYLGPEKYGTYTLLIWIAALAVAAANHGLITGVTKFVGEARGQRSPELARGVLLYCERLQIRTIIVVCAIIGILIASVGQRIVAGADAQLLLWLLLPAVAARALYLFYFAAARGFEDFRLAARVHWLVAPLSVAVVLAAAHRGATLKAFVCAYALGCVLYALAMRAALFRSRQRSGAAICEDMVLNRIRRHVLYASAIVVLELLVLRQTELIFLNRFSTQENLAYYGLGRSLSASAILLIPGVLTGLMLPVMSRTFGEDPSLLGARFLSATRYILILAVPVVVLCEVFGADLIRALYGPEYAPAVLVFRVAVVASAVGVISASASSYQLGTDRQPTIVAIMAGVAVLTLGLDYVLIRAYELNGAIAAGAIGSVALAVGLLAHARHTLRVKLGPGMWMRALAAGAGAAIAAVMVRAVLPLWLALPAGTIAVAAVYAVLTLALRAWSADDLRSMSALTDRLPAGLGRAIRPFLTRPNPDGSR